MHVLVAPNAFKNSIDANNAAKAIHRGLLKSKLNCTVTCFPIADGGDGTAPLLIEYLGGEWIQQRVDDPLGRKINSQFGWIKKTKTAIIELAAASGLRLLKPNEYDPLKANTKGTGELMLAALRHRAEKIIFCIGGSATVDGGTGILSSIGVKFIDKGKKILNDLPSALSSLAEIDLSDLDKRIHHCNISVLCDVDNTMLGEKGAAAVFGPQKGASKSDVEKLDQLLSVFSDVTLRQLGKNMSVLKHGGAAGGVAAALHTFLNASLENGIESFLDFTNFDNELDKADLVITAEGSIDSQTLNGKGPFGVARRAKQRSLPVVGLAGIVPEIPDAALQKYFDRLISINEEVTDIETAIRNTFTNLELTSRKLGDELSSSTVQN